MSDISKRNSVSQDFRVSNPVREAIFFGRGAIPDMDAAAAYAVSHNKQLIRAEKLGFFSNGEIEIIVAKEEDSNLRGRHITFHAPKSENLYDDMMETLLMLDAFRRNGCVGVDLVLPESLHHFSAADHPDSPISPELFFDMLKLFSTHLHSIQTAEGKPIVVENLPAVAMRTYPGKKTVIVHGHSSGKSAHEIATLLNNGVTVVDWRDPSLDFSDTNVIVIASADGNPNQAVLENAAMIRSVRERGAAIVQDDADFFHYSRQERSSNRRVPISAKVVARLWDRYLPNSIMTLDLHADAIEGFTEHASIQAVYSTVVHATIISDLFDKGILKPEEVLIGAVDRGAIPRARQLQRQLIERGYPVSKVMPTVHKTRTAQGAEAESISDAHLLAGKTVIFVDDMTATLTTLLNGADIAKHPPDIYGSNGEQKLLGANQVITLVTHVLRNISQNFGPGITGKMRSREGLIDLFVGLDTVAGSTPEIEATKNMMIASAAPWKAMNLRHLCWWLPKPDGSPRPSLKTLNDGGSEKPTPPEFRTAVLEHLVAGHQTPPAAQP